MSNLTPRINKLEKNIIIDGAMEIWPEGTIRNVLNNTRAYSSVLTSLTNVSSGVTLTATQQASVPSGTNLVFSNEISKTAAGTFSAATSVANDYFIEGYDTTDIYNKEFSFLFWVKSSVASLRSVSLLNAGTTHSFVQQYTINSPNTWELKVLKFPALSTCPGTINRTNGIGARLTTNVVTGSTFQTATLNQWVSGAFVSGVGEDTTWITGTSHNFSIAGVMLIPGDLTSLTSSGYDFVRAGRNFEDELSMTQRYFERIDPTLNSHGFFGSVGSVGTTGSGLWTFKSTKRATPTLGAVGPITLALRNVGAITPSQFTPGVVNTNSYYAEFNFSVAQQVGTPLILTAGSLTADARF